MLHRKRRILLAAALAAATLVTFAPQANASPYGYLCGTGNLGYAVCTLNGAVVSNNGSTMTVAVDCTATVIGPTVITDVVCFLLDSSGHGYYGPIFTLEDTFGNQAAYHALISVPTGTYRVCIAGGWGGLVAFGTIPTACGTLL